MILMLSPILLILAVIARINMGAPVVFRQKRPGLHGKPFIMFKFRSMIEVRDLNGVLLPDRDRVTWFGNFLRKTSLDELPELLNVIKGEMSLIGPRPLAMVYLPYYTKEEMRRHDVRPGITGWAQVNGRNALSWEEKFKFDLEYVNNCSFLLDVKIFVMTIISVLKRSNIGERGTGTVIDFHEYRKVKESQN
jgi:sugar transferase EpsL